MLKRPSTAYKLVGIALGFVLAALAFSITKTTQQEGRLATPVMMNPRGITVEITLGPTASEPAEWNARVSASEGKVVLMSPTRQEIRPEPQLNRKGGPRRQQPPSGASTGPTVLQATFDAPLTARAEVATSRGNFSFVLSDLRLGRRATFLNGSATVERIPLTQQVTSEPTEDDFPACAVGPDGAIWCAYVAYHRGTPIQTEEIKQGKFESLVTRNNGDQVRLLKFDGREWKPPVDVTGAGLDVWRPALTIDPQGTVWVIWSQNVDGDWDLFARRYDPKVNQWSVIQRVTREAGADINVVATTTQSGIIWLAWQRWENSDFAIRAQTLGDLGKGSRHTRNFGGSNEWTPSIAADSKGKVYIAFDTYNAGNYDTYVWILDEKVASPTGETIPIANSPRFEARPTITVDKQDRIWIAYEEADPNWAKDFGSRWEGKSGVPFYLDRNIVVRCLSDGKLQQTKAEIKSDLINTMYPPSQRQRLSFPRLCADDSGKVWLLFRRHPLTTGAGERWMSYATYYDGDSWSTQVLLPHSENLLDNRPALVSLKGSGLLAVYASDGRTAGTNTAVENNLYAAVLQAETSTKQPVLVATQSSGDGKIVEPVHPSEAEDIRRIRTYRASIGGKEYQLLRGEFHRHTEISSHRDQDGPFEEIWRYGLDVAKMDWIGPGDHDNGQGREYTWWLTQKQVEMYHYPSTFIPMFTYERSVVYPSGHRNVMFAKRGIRPLPRMGTAQQEDLLFGKPDMGAPDVKNLYAYLKFFDGICSSHTSATNMGTDWRDNDSAVEPVVEIFQGHRQNYEEPNAPKAAKNAEDSIGGYQPAGYVWNAFAKGYKLGFQVSSDHVSTHISYAIVMAENRTREGILSAFKKRHSYGANDNIILDVRCDSHLMGDEFTVRSNPKFEIVVGGTAPVGRLDIVRQIDKTMPTYVYALEPKQKDVKLSWTDNSAKAGALNMYYVRIMQEDGKMAWASPMWIHYKASAR